ncbi:MAG: hypothetical protein ACLSA6_04405 [Holdemania massiliensis]
MRLSAGKLCLTTYSLHLDAQGQIRARERNRRVCPPDDLDKGSACRMDRSIFLIGKCQCPRGHPAAPYDTIITDQKVDLFHANNYADQRGLRAFDSKEEAVRTFIEGKQFALGATQEKGLSATFFDRSVNAEAAGMFEDH